jgi:hypothetical protein
MELRSESVETDDFSGPKGGSKNGLSGWNRIEIPCALNIDFGTEKARLSALAAAGLVQCAG